MIELSKKNPIDKFLKNEGKNVKTLLLGNGFCLDHPVLGKRFKFTSEDIFSLIGKIGLYLGKNEVERLRRITCPEKFLNIFRWAISKEVILHYAEAVMKGIEEFDKKNAKEENSWKKYGNIHKNFDASQTLSKFDKIFTVNYDPLMYFSLIDLIRLQEDNKKQFKRLVVDGFRGHIKITKSEQIKRMEKYEGIKVYYLHGANFIMYDNSCKTLYKLNPDEIIPEKILYEKDSESNDLPDIIFESRWYIKKAHFEGCEYLNYCTKQLIQSEGDLLIFGMSLENDAHIIDILLKYAEHHRTNKRKIFITYMEDKDKDDMRSNSHTPRKKIRSIAERDLAEYYENIEVERRISLENRLNLLENMIEELQISRKSDKEDVTGIFWKKNGIIKKLKSKLK